MIKLNRVVIAAAAAVIVVFAAVLSWALWTRPAAAHMEDDGTVCVPILMYHEVKLTNAGRDVITPGEFEEDLNYLKTAGYTTVTMGDLIDYVYDAKPLPEKPVVLTFDDGYLNNYVYVFPLLKKYHTKIVLSIIGKNTDDFTYIPDDNINYSHVTWKQLKEMSDSGLVEVQNHTYDLHKITRSRFGCGKRQGETQAHYEKALTDDLGRLQSEIRIFTGRTPTTFTYPYGKVSSDSLPILKEMGFKASLSCDYGVNLLSDDPDTLFGLKRICRLHGVSAQKSIDGAMKTLNYR